MENVSKEARSDIKVTCYIVSLFKDSKNKYALKNRIRQQILSTAWDECIKQIVTSVSKGIRKEMSDEEHTTQDQG